jgi:hypothetical protein
LGRREHPDACDWELIEADHDLELIEAVQVIRVLRHGRAAHGELGVLECELHEKAAVRNAISRIHNACITDRVGYLQIHQAAASFGYCTCLSRQIVRYMRILVQPKTNSRSYNYRIDKLA